MQAGTPNYTKGTTLLGKIKEYFVERRFNRAERLLRELGPRPVDVYRNLLEYGISGERHKHSSCPISNFLVEKGGIPKASTGVTTGLLRNGVHSRIIDLPKPITAFVREFDSGKYEGLTYDYMDNEQGVGLCVGQPA